MLNNFINFILKFQLFYDISQTKRELLKEFREDLKKEKTLQNPITVEVYKALNKTDKIIIDRFKDYYRNGNNAVYLSMKLNYSCDGIKRRLKIIANTLHNSIITYEQSVQMR